MKRPPEPPAVCWSLVGDRWYRVDGGTPEQMTASAASRTEVAAPLNPSARFEVTCRGADGRCPEPAS